MEKYRNNRHLFLFDYDENKIKNKEYSDKVLDTFNIDKNLYYLSFKSHDRFQISAIEQNHHKFNIIIVTNFNNFIHFYGREYFLEPSSYSFNDLLDYKDSDFKNFESTLLHNQIKINVSFKELVFENKKLLNVEHISDNVTDNTLIKKLDFYNITGEQREQCLKSDEIITKQMQNKKIFFQTIVSYKLNQNIQDLFKEIPVGTSY